MPVAGNRINAEHVLVIFNRRVTLRQVNSSLAQISQQIKELQDRGQKPS